MAKYGTDHHGANVAIAKEIGLPEASVVLVDSISFSQLPDVVADTSYERKILQYADTRVGPLGILPLEERLREGRARYLKTRSVRDYYESDEEFEHLHRAAQELERQVMSLASLAPKDITDATVNPLIEGLRKYPV